MIHKDKLDPIVEKIIDEAWRPVIDISIREIAEEVYQRTGYLPSPSVVKYSLDRLGAVNTNRRWIYKHKRSHE